MNYTGQIYGSVIFMVKTFYQIYQCFIAKRFLIINSTITSTVFVIVELTIKIVN